MTIHAGLIVTLTLPALRASLPLPVGEEFRVVDAPGIDWTARGAVHPKLGPLGAAEWEG